MNIVIEYDSSVADAPAGFKTAVNAAVAYFDQTITNPITVPIMFSYGELDGASLSSSALGESSTNGYYESYLTLVSQLTAAATSSTARTAIATLPATDPTNGGGFWVSDAQAQVFGINGQANFNDPENGFVALGTAAFTYDPNNRAVTGEYDAIGVLEHEISEALGRISYLGASTLNGVTLYTPMDLFRYTSAGVHDLTNTAGYFSIDGQNMLMAYNDPTNGGDAGDWATTGANDAFDAFIGSGVEETISANDLLELNAIGFSIAPSSAPTPSFLTTSGAVNVLWEDSNNEVYVLSPSLTSSFVTDDVGSAGTLAFQGVGAFAGGPATDILWRDTNGQVDLWLTNSTSTGYTEQSLAGVPANWTVQGVGDFNGDGKADVLWRDNTGTVQLWLSNSGTGYTGFSGQTLVGVPTNWTVQGVGDFNGDGKSDVLWRDQTGTVELWVSNAGAGYSGFSGQTLVGVPTNWTIEGVADFNGDGKSDVLWRDQTGTVQLWVSNPGAGYTGFTGETIAGVPTSWTIEQVGDFNGDGKADILWRNASGDVDVWMSNTGAGYNGFTGHDYGVVAADWHLL